MAQRIFNISNLLSASRIIILFPVGYCLITDFPYHRWWTAGLIIIGIATDLLDGFIARKLHQVTDFGKFIDPFADKIAVGIYAVLLAWTGDVPIWFIVLVLLRDALIFFGGLYIRLKKGIIPQSNWPGKMSVNLIALVFFLATIQVNSLERIYTIAIWASIVMMIWSMWSYSKRLFIGRNVEVTE